MYGDEIIEVFKGNVVLVYVAVILPLSVLVPLRVQALSDFTIYRLQHFDLQGVSHGTYVSTGAQSSLLCCRFFSSSTVLRWLSCSASYCEGY